VTAYSGNRSLTAGLGVKLGAVLSKKEFLIMRHHRPLFILFFWIACLSAGQAPGDILPTPAFPRPMWFRQHFSKPSGRVELAQVRSLSDQVVNGKLELSLRTYIELVMANNTDIALEKLTIVTPGNAVTRAFASFDPVLDAVFTNERTISPTTSVLEGGQETLKTLYQPGSAVYRQLLETGTSFSVGFAAQKYSTNSLFSTFNPALSTNLSLNFEQPLLQGRGAYVNRLPVMVARGRLRISHSELRDRVITLLAAAENAYWDVVEARENLKLQERLLELRGTALTRAKKQLELGALLPLDIYQPQADYATVEVAVIQARYQLAQRENGLRQQIGADLDPAIRSLPIELTDPVSPAITPPQIEREIAVQTALEQRPDLRAAAQAVDVDDLEIERATHGLRPRLSLIGRYISQGRGGTFMQRGSPFDPNSTDVVAIPGGIGNALDQLFHFNFPVYSFGLRLSLPIRDRRAAADLGDALVRKKQNALRLQKLHQSVRLEVLNTVDQLEASEASLRRAAMARDFAQKRFEAEQKKYELGITPLFFVLDAQTQLSRAENDVLRQAINYRRGLVGYQRVTGQLLEERGVLLEPPASSPPFTR
jgi:outer membrane protein TolC